MPTPVPPGSNPGRPTQITSRLPVPPPPPVGAAPAPPAPKKPTPQEFEEKVNLAKNVIGSLERALKTRRLYEPDHPLYQESTADLMGRFDAFFAKYAYLRFDVTQSELKMEGRPVMVCEARDPEVPFRLYKDGIRELKFQKGLAKPELVDFLSVLELDTKRLQEMDEDMVSLAWTKGFATIQYTAIDEFEGVSEERWPGLDAGLVGVAKEIAQGVKETIRAMTSRLSAGRSSAPVALAGVAGPDTQILRRIRPPAAPAPEIEAAEMDVFFSAGTDPIIQSLREEVDREGLSGAVERAFALLLRIVATSKSLTAADIGPFLRGLVAFYAARGDLGGMGHLVSRAASSGLFEKLEGAAPVKKQLIEDATAPAVRKYLLAYVNGVQDEDEGLQRYFDLAAGALVPDACAAFPKAASEQARRVLKDFLLKHGRGPTTGWNDLVPAIDRFGADIVEILKTVKPANVVIDIDAVLKRPEMTLRLQMISTIVAVDVWPRTRLLSRVLADPTDAIRAHALRQIAEARDPGLRPLMQTWIEDPAFANRSGEEKIAAFKALARAGGPAMLGFMRARAEPVDENEKTKETRRAAVFGIREIGTPEAMNLLKVWFDAGDDQLKFYASEAMRMR